MTKEIELTPRQEAIVDQLLSLRKRPLESGRIARKEMRDFLRSLPTRDLACVWVGLKEYERCSAGTTKTKGTSR